MVSNSFLRLGLTTRRVSMLLMAVVLMGLPLYALPQPAVEPAEQELSVEQILEKHYEAIGGAHHQSIESMKMTGTSVVMGMEAPLHPVHQASQQDDAGDLRAGDDRGAGFRR